MNPVRTVGPLSISILLSAFVSAAPVALHAQMNPDSAKVLVIQREVTKPGKDGAVHEATEAGFIRAVQANKGNIHYIAFTSLTGQNRAIFISAYPSIEAIEQERKAMPAAAMAAMDKAMTADGDALSDASSTIWFRRDDMSSNVSGPPVGMRLMEVSEFVVKPGHEHEFDELAKMYVEAAKNIPEMHWTTYQLAYGVPYGDTRGPTFLVLTALKSGAEADAEFAAGKRFDDALGESGRKRFAELEAASVASEMTNLSLVSPKMSIPPDQMVKAEPEFWKPKIATSTATKKATAKSATATGQ